ncbi:MAG: hypothetical protein A3H96_06370 [Acidobacteria bacterium RIFCSPLOWO2_02_FULL_67_36]|nr:MAG: hypothetical protein A3H96_06370 [Acidobacteria bacterium RIFCSPLOWO2_02_FULL_67_36]OFW25908.1 MAG: hypothetical protein A3G21_15210 [Acidobacteria bacterium RIFCSPLOWO2_12_FULL_66_21]
MSTAETLFIAHQPAVLRYLTRVVGQADTARDLTQEVFLRVSRSSIPAAGVGELRGWIFRIARNLALNHLRDAAARPATVALTDVAVQAAGQEIGVSVQQALDSLESLDRDIFVFRETAGLSYAEIASACELTVDAVRSRLHRARVQLRDVLSAEVAQQRAAGVRLTRGEP